MPTRKISERERLTMYARSASDDELDEALEILTVERRVRNAKKPTTNPKPRTRPVAKAEKVPGPPNPPKPDNDNPVG